MARYFWCPKCKKKTKHNLREYAFYDAGICDQCGKEKAVGDWYDY